MITLDQLTEMLGWASVINIAFLSLAVLMLTVMKNLILSIHSKIFGISENELKIIYVKYIAVYKILTFTLLITPYLALKVMGY